MAIISKKTWNNMPKAEKEKIIAAYNSFSDAPSELDYWVKKELEAIFGKDRLVSKPRIRIWEDVIKTYPARITGILGLQSEIRDVVGINENIARKIVATAKIEKLIEFGYGGIVTKDEWADKNRKKYVVAPAPNKEMTVYGYDEHCGDNFVAFHTKYDAKEFMKHKENIKLLIDYYMMS